MVWDLWRLYLLGVQSLADVAPRDRVEDLTECAKLAFGRVQRLETVAKLAERVLRLAQARDGLHGDLAVALEGGIAHSGAASFRIGGGIGLRLTRDRFPDLGQVRIRVLGS